MTKNKELYGCIFTISGLLYVLLYFAYIFYIDFAHSSYSVISVPAILIPFILFLLVISTIWKVPAIKNSVKAKSVLILTTIMGALPVLICAIMLGINESKSKFTSEKWNENISERVYMVDDLLDTYDLNGMSKSKVIALLGAPNEETSFSSEENAVYYLGNERGWISIDSEWLIIEFDSSNKVKNYFITTD